MLKSLRIKNFKAWEDTGNIRLAPLTVIFGANSSGKSSLGHLLLALKQTALSTDRRRALHLGDSSSLIDLGTLEECIHNHDLTKSLQFNLSWQKDIKVEDPSSRKKYSGDTLMLDVCIQEGKAKQPEIEQIRYDLQAKDSSVLDINYLRKESGNFDLKSSNYSFVRTPGRPWSFDPPEKFYRISESSRARLQNAAVLADFALATEEMLGKFYYLGPLREAPKRTYQWAGEAPEDVGFNGEYAIRAILAAQSENRQFNLKTKEWKQSFDKLIASQLKTLGVIHDFSVMPVAEGRKEYEVLLKTHASASQVKITDVGFGISQVLPALVQAFYCPPGSVVWMEQPEIHLHPNAQVGLADVMINAIKARENGKSRNVQLIIESHSEHFLNRLQRRIAEGTIAPDDIAIYFCYRNGPAAVLDPLEIDIDGEISNWPENFFGDEMAELTARLTAAANRHDKGSN